jgi:hypothetical protein
MKFKLIFIVLFLFLLVFLFYPRPAFITGRTTGFSNVSTTINAVYNILNVSPISFELKIPPANKSEDSINISAEFPGNTGLNVTLNKSGEIAGWITLETLVVNLSYGEYRIIDFNITVPEAQSLGIYYGWINLTSEDGQKKDVNITVNVTEQVGRINVTVNNTIGNPVVAATVFIWDTIPSLVDSGSTNDNGNWLSDWLEPENYTVEVVKDGYETQTKNITLAVGEAEQTFITLQPIAAPVLDVSPLTLSESGFVGQRITKILTIRNIGDMNLINITLNSTSDWISFDTQFIPIITPGNYTYVNAYLGPIANTGTYLGTININSSNDGDEIIPVAFQISTPSAPPTPGGGTPGISTPPKIEALNASLSIVEYVEKVIVNEGDIKFISVHVKNTGNRTLKDVKLSIQGIPTDWYSVDKEKVDLDINETEIFIVKLEIPLGTASDALSIAIQATSGLLSDIKSFLLTIKQTEVSLRIKDIKISKFFVYKEGQINVTLKNEMVRAVDVTVNLDFPEDFIVNKKTLSDVIEMKKEKSFNFVAIAKKAGMFVINMTVFYDGKVLMKDIMLNVSEPEININVTVLIVVLIIAFIVICILIYKNYTSETITT